MDETREQLRKAWEDARKAYHAAIEAYGWDDARTVELEALEAEASDRYLASQGVR